MDKVAFQIGPWPVHWYGVLVALGFVLGLWTASRRGMREGLRPEQIMDAGPWLVIGSIVGARLLYVISYWERDFAREPWQEIFMVQHGGLVFYGGLLGAFLATYFYLRRKQLPLWKFLDCLTPSLPLGYVFGRLGCLMNGCCYGQACPWSWAIRFPTSHETQGSPVHPTQLYDSLLNLLLYGALAALYRRKKFEGQIFAVYLLAYAITRSLVEFFRGDYPVRYFGGLATPAQLVSIGIFIAGAVLYQQLRKRRPLTSNIPVTRSAVRGK